MLLNFGADALNSSAHGTTGFEVARVMTLLPIGALVSENEMPSSRFAVKLTVPLPTEPVMFSLSVFPGRSRRPYP